MPLLTLERGQGMRVDFAKNTPFMFGCRAPCPRRLGTSRQAGSCDTLRVEARGGLWKGPFP